MIDGHRRALRSPERLRAANIGIERAKRVRDSV
jgi:hypothetical protein